MHIINTLIDVHYLRRSIIVRARFPCFTLPRGFVLKCPEICFQKSWKKWKNVGRQQIFTKTIIERSHHRDHLRTRILNYI